MVFVYKIQFHLIPLASERLVDVMYVTSGSSSSSSIVTSIILLSKVTFSIFVKTILNFLLPVYKLLLIIGILIVLEITPGL